MDKKNVKEFGRALILGSGVVIATPFVLSLASKLPYMNTDIFGLLTIGTALSAGVAAFGIDFLLEKYMK